ncbi:MAG: V-type ATP synthase subunit D [Methanoregulaceae archaeon PtaB.Bin009]|jgi:V/A-type H+-transporting ATPase subunit D|nr:MAG: V-type ATP synthase subunit D [Methanoregulaceae archaeon PtaB.Bin009]OPY39633.1 MAG: V-type ATP synthase subunit D [Methanoregulaceae archaeon PtaU1.Bin066]HNQ29886.1 V-type ATP synthase subunit D [Methanolinea sp.]
MKVKLSQGELKRQRDALRQYERYLPTLQLKKQQIQLEILSQQGAMRKARAALSRKMEAASEWSGLLTEDPGIARWLLPEQVVTARKNVAGVDLPVFERAEFETAEYDLFLAPLWLDRGLEVLREIVSLQEEIRVLETGISILHHDLRITTQRVNLFEKVKIPEAKEAIRLIKIHLGDQMTNAVGRSKIAKKKIEASNASEAGP